jgi:hypothetical protein
MLHARRCGARFQSPAARVTAACGAYKSYALPAPGHVSFVFYAVAGLETVFFACLIVLLHWGLLESRYLLAATAAGLAALCRPEGFLLVSPPDRPARDHLRAVRVST